ncbi:MAG: acyl-CoA dehydratase activase [Candidatus Adiutrix sp.]|jgi:predicted CoA-substrate-specific enzyme activase|nr:acyl-CoA dehydratase activase [Candidatus Adiutrix sp.]
MDIKIGLDLGSTAIKMVVVEGDQIIGRRVAPTSPGQDALAQKLIDGALAELGRKPAEIRGVASTGYGKKLFTGAGMNIDEISANALGLFRLSGGQARTIINIGGQDLKVLNLSEAGKITDFRMNDKCAAGTGRFFELVARLLDTPLERFGELSRAGAPDLELNNTCVVFAESEIVSLLARGESRETIIRGLHGSVARRVAGMVHHQLPDDGAVYLDGGPANNPGLKAALEDELMVEVKVLAEPQFTVAYGAALALS